jgi:hypothetical protein
VLHDRESTEQWNSRRHAPLCTRDYPTTTPPTNTLPKNHATLHAQQDQEHTYQRYLERSHWHQHGRFQKHFIWNVRIPAVFWAFPLASAWNVPETFHMKRKHTSGISSVPTGISMEGPRRNFSKLRNPHFITYDRWETWTTPLWVPCEQIVT